MASKLLMGIASCLAFVAAATANEPFDPFSRKTAFPSLKFPDQPRPAFPDMNMMFKPDGTGPFPAVVIMPGCSGHDTMNAFDWAMRATTHGYAVLVVDPLTQREVVDNCPGPVDTAQALKDAFDGANHLRQQSFVDRTRIGLIGLSLGGMAGLGAASSTYWRRDGSDPFQAVVSLYPLCSRKGRKLPERPDPVDMQFVREKIVVPILVEMGDEDMMVAGGTAADCKPLLDEQKAQGAPLEYVIYHATHSWDEQESDYGSEPHTMNFNGRIVPITYNSEVTRQSANDTFAFLDRRLKGSH
jgi:dienelactone hydrolase